MAQQYGGLPGGSSPAGGRLALRAALISVSGLVGTVVRGAEGDDLGRVWDVTVRWDGGEYPPVSGIVLKVGGRKVFVHATDIAGLSPGRTRLRTNRLVLDEFRRRAGEVLLMADVVDRQLVDTDGVQVIRASDLYLARVGERVVLVGAEVGLGALMRRLGPARLRERAVPSRVIDWSLIQPFANPGESIGLTRSRADLPRLRPSDLADLLEDLATPKQQELLAALDPHLAADAVEDMHEQDVADLFRNVPVEDAVRLLEHMDPDEAADALRDLEQDRQEQLLEALTEDHESSLRAVLTWDEDLAGGIMNSQFIHARQDQTIADGIQEFRRHWTTEHSDPGFLVVVDTDGRLVDTIRLVELIAADPTARLSDVVAAPWPVRVSPTDDLDTVTEHLRASRGEALVVLDADNRPIGRIDSDDVVDALTEDTPHGIVWKATH